MNNSQDKTMTDYRLKILLILTAALPLSLSANAGAPTEGKPLAEGIVDPGASNAPRLEIRKYRFFHDSKLKRERLVLEFDRRDFYHESKPRLSFEALSAQEILVKLENAVLLGAVPESLINKSYAEQSEYMGAISMDDRNMDSGLAIKVKMKDFDLGYNAQWLSNPNRLVVDVYPKTGPAAKQLVRGHSESRAPKSLATEHKMFFPSVSDFMCFPAKSKVGLSVVFQPSARSEEVQKFRVNTDGSAIGLNSDVDKESIICYPKTSQVKAQLSFQVQGAEFSNSLSGGHSAAPAAATPSLLNMFPQMGTAPAPTAHAAPAAPVTSPVTAPLIGSENDLDPGPVVGGNSEPDRGTASSAPSVSPASLLPPLGN